ncbi:MAG: NRDE family protein [Candidatus Krumholzibacteriia bacterium]
MCLLILAHDVHPHLPLVVAANRDEFLDRPTAPLAEWSDAPGVFAGRDLRAGGTWMGVTRSGRWAAVTNVREPHDRPEAASRDGFAAAADASEDGGRRLSRGALVADYLRSTTAPADHLAAVAARARRYDGFNLLVGDTRGIWYLSNRVHQPLAARGDPAAPEDPAAVGSARSLQPPPRVRVQAGVAGPLAVPAGIHGLSNAGLDSPWPKLMRGRERLGTLVAGACAPSPADALVEPLLALLADRTVPLDRELPDTGVGLAWERTLGSSFIVAEGYGTRSSTVLIRDGGGALLLVERTFAHEPHDPPLAGLPVVSGERRLRIGPDQPA